MLTLPLDEQPCLSPMSDPGNFLHPVHEFAQPSREHRTISTVEEPVKLKPSLEPLRHLQHTLPATATGTLAGEEVSDYIESLVKHTEAGHGVSTGLDVSPREARMCTD